MIHKAWMCSCGNADDMAKAAALLEKLDGTLAATYAAETGQDAATIAAWMRDETWFDAQDAVDKGFADRIAEGAAKNLTAWNLSAFRNAPGKSGTEAPAHESPTDEQAEQEEHPASAASAERDYYLRRLAVAERSGR